MYTAKPPESRFVPGLFLSLWSGWHWYPSIPMFILGFVHVSHSSITWDCLRVFRNDSSFNLNNFFNPKLRRSIIWILALLYQRDLEPACGCPNGDGQFHRQAALHARGFPLGAVWHAVWWRRLVNRVCSDWWRSHRQRGGGAGRKSLGWGFLGSVWWDYLWQGSLVLRSLARGLKSCGRFMWEAGGARGGKPRCRTGRW